MTIEGALRFARFAVPPNERGYCGPDRAGELAAYRAEELTADRGLVELAEGFEGAWPYLELLAGMAGSTDPLDDRVVEAYWIGNDLCQKITTADWGWHLRDRFGPRAGRDAAQVTAGVGHGALPHHAFHVFCVYPWVGLLREGRGGSDPLRILRQCHISWGVVHRRVGDFLDVEGPTLVWVDGRLGLGPMTARTVWLDPRLTTLSAKIHDGSTVAIHWDQVVDVLDQSQVAWLDSTNRSQLALSNSVGMPIL